MQFALVALLIVSLAAATISFGVIGLLQRRRVSILFRCAHRMGLRFSGEDPFDAARRYAAITLISCGHGARANNVTYGQWGHLPVRAFDFRFEVGHGTRRMTRNYMVAVAETDQPVAATLMWNKLDSAWTPLEALRCPQDVGGQYTARGDALLLDALSDLAAPLASDGAGLQSAGTQVAVWMPFGRMGRDYSAAIEVVAQAARFLVEHAGGEAASVQTGQQNIETAGQA